MSTIFTYRYAKFRQKRKNVGKVIEASVIAMIFLAIAVLMLTENLHYMTAAMAVIFVCMCSLLFFKKAEKFRRVIPE